MWLFLETIEDTGTRRSARSRETVVAHRLILAGKLSGIIDELVSPRDADYSYEIYKEYFRIYSALRAFLLMSHFEYSFVH